MFLSFSPPEIPPEIPPEMDDFLGDNPQGIQGWSWKANAKRKKQHLKRRQRLELDLSEALGRYFTFHDVTQLTPELHAGDRLQAIRYAAGKLWTNFSIPARWCPLMLVGFLFTHPTRLYHKPKRQAIVIPMFKTNLAKKICYTAPQLVQSALCQNICVPPTAANVSSIRMCDSRSYLQDFAGANLCGAGELKVIGLLFFRCQKPIFYGENMSNKQLKHVNTMVSGEDFHGFSQVNRPKAPHFPMIFQGHRGGRLLSLALVLCGSLPHHRGPRGRAPHLGGGQRKVRIPSGHFQRWIVVHHGIILGWGIIHFGYRIICFGYGIICWPVHHGDDWWNDD